MTCRSRGYSIPELLTVVIIIATIALISIPAFSQIHRRRVTRTAMAEMRGIFSRTRSMAIARSRQVAIKFSRAGDDWHYALFVDGNGNGVRNAEITSGTDRMVQPYRKVLQGTGIGRIGLPSYSIQDPDTGRALPPHTSPVRFNQSSLCSYSPLGESTSGSIFLTDGQDNAAMVRVYGPDARVRVFTFDRATGRWKK